MKVLLIDDEKELVATLAERLDLRGYEAEWVTSGEAGLEKMESADYQWVVLDLKMPGINGCEMIEKVKGRHPDTKIILATGHTSSKELDDCLAAGADHFLLKPFDINDLMEIFG